jgi:hypothetical protein
MPVIIYKRLIKTIGIHILGKERYVGNNSAQAFFIEKTHTGFSINKNQHERLDSAMALKFSFRFFLSSDEITTVHTSVKT